jgi:hypothetical protein
MAEGKHHQTEKGFLRYVPIPPPKALHRRRILRRCNDVFVIRCGGGEEQNSSTL